MVGRGALRGGARAGTFAGVPADTRSRPRGGTGDTGRTAGTCWSRRRLGRFKSRPRRRRDDFHRGLTRRASGTRTAGRATSRDGRAVRNRPRAARRTSEANETRYTPRSASAACQVECDELAIFVTHHPSVQSRTSERHHHQWSSVLPRAFSAWQNLAQNCPSRRKSRSPSVCAFPRHARLWTLERSSLITLTVYTSPIPPPTPASVRSTPRRALARTSRLVYPSVCPSRRRRSQGSNERRRHFVPRASFLR